MEITTSTRTIVQNEFTITLSEADVAAILVDPAPFQSQLRAARSANHKGQHGAKSITIGRRPKGRAAKKRVSASDQTPCEFCGKPIKHMAIHLSTCKLNPANLPEQ